MKDRGGYFEAHITVEASDDDIDYEIRQETMRHGGEPLDDPRLARVKDQFFWWSKVNKDVDHPKAVKIITARAASFDKLDARCADLIDYLQAFRAPRMKVIRYKIEAAVFDRFYE